MSPSLQTHGGYTSHVMGTVSKPEVRFAIREIQKHDRSMSETSSRPLTGACFCGAVTYALSLPPVLRAYCHCTQCQRLTGMRLSVTQSDNEADISIFWWQGCPFIHTVHFPVSAFAWTHDAPVDSFVNPVKPWKTRTRCRRCGVTVSSHNSKTNRISVWGAHFARDDSGRILRWDELKPTAHIFYGTRLLDIEDGLGKWEGYEGNSLRIA